jgi:hypothetical protein
MNCNIIERIFDNKLKLKNKFIFNKSVGKLETNVDLVREMVYLLPESLFVSDDTKFLDPCAGTGTFMIIILERLLKYKSYDIAIKQIYMSEINPSLVNGYLSNMIFLPKSKIKLEISSDWINDYFNLFISNISNKTKTFNDISYIIYSESIKNEIDKMILNITKFIEKYEKISKLESKLFGEVFTPQKLIKEMLSYLPADIWGDKNLKWIDPAVGIGNFPSVIIENLMKGLEEEIPVESERYKWIMEEMVYMCDISTKNLFLLYKLFDENNSLKLNVYRGSFLEEGFDKHMRDVWGIEGFDVVVGNPPYQHPTNKRWKLWVSFLEKISLFENKYLLFVTPIAWMNGSGEELSNAKKIIFNKGIKSIKIDVNTYFKGVGENIGYYLCDGERNEMVNIITDDNHFQIENDGSFIINSDDKIKNSIFHKMASDSKFDFKNINTDIKSKVENGSFSKNLTNTHITKVVHSASNIFYTSDDFSSLQKEGVIINWSGHFYKKDDDKYLYRSIMDVSGRNTKKVITNNENESISLISYFKSKVIRFYVNSKKTSGFNTPLFDVPKISLSKIYIDVDLYEYFNLTQEEIDLIEKTIKD